MLGYDLEDLNIMMDSLADAIASNKLDSRTLGGLTTSLSFLQGLWAEGYFDGYQDQQILRVHEASSNQS